MPLHVTTVLLCLKLLITYSSLTLLKKFFVHQTINPLSVSTRSSGKRRLILDLRHVNAFVYKQKFKCEDLSVATQIFDKEYYLFKFNLKSGFHHIEIFPEHRKYLAFAWDFGTGKFRYFQFCVLPFVLSSAPFIFTQILKPLQKSWRSRGIPIAIFLDDGLGGGIDKVSAKIHRLAVHSDLLKFGFVPNQENSVWEPVQVITWLGVVRNTIDGSVQATDERIAKLTSNLGHYRHCVSNSVFARFTLKVLPMLGSRLFHFALAWGQLLVL